MLNRNRAVFTQTRRRRTSREPILARLHESSSSSSVIVVRKGYRESSMENESVKLSEEEEEDEYVMIDLDDVSRHIDIPSDAPYTLSGLDTLNPVLTIDGKIKLVGEYIETIGTCLAFSDKEVSAGENQTPQKTVEPVAKLHKILKFRVAPFDDENGETKTTNNL